MEKILKSIAILLFKFVVYYLLYTVFFQLFGIQNLVIQYASRIIAITTLTFFVVFGLLLIVYNNFPIGIQKCKPIIFSTTISVFLADIVTFIQLMSLNIESQNNQVFRINHVYTLLYVIILQVVIISIAAYFGNWMYNKLSTTEEVLIVKSNETDVNTILKIQYFLSNLKHKFRLVDVLDYSSIVDSDFSNITRVVCVGIKNDERSKLTNFCYERGIIVSFTPEINDVLEFSGKKEFYEDISLIVVEPNGLSFEQKFCKRILDLFCSILGLILSSPIWIISAIAIKLNDGGKIFFRQERYTKDGKVFRVFKFRTMKENVENYSSTENDDRITAVGRMLRKTRMDELPQILNIIKGEMSMVGPRPEMIENVHKYEKELPQFNYRLKVKAGLTGIAQIEGKYNTTPKDKLIMDLMYIQNYSIWTDIKLILRTPLVLVKKESTQGFSTDE